MKRIIKKEWEKKFEKIVNKWEEPEWEFERYDKLINYTRNLILEMKSFIRQLLKQEKEKTKSEIIKIILDLEKKTNIGEYPIAKNHISSECKSAMCIGAYEALRELFNQINRGVLVRQHKTRYRL